jgi:hypothetical protein
MAGETSECVTAGDMRGGVWRGDVSRAEFEAEATQVKSRNYNASMRAFRDAEGRR